MEIKGIVEHILPEQGGTSKANGNSWRKQEFVIKTEGNYPKSICFALWGDKIDQAGLKPGEMINVSFDAESREYNGRWYTELKAYRVSKEGEFNPSSAPPPPAAPYADRDSSFQADRPIQSGLDGGDDELPF
jgi:hypothetical protein